MALPRGIIQQFEEDTKYPLSTYLEKFVDFVDNKYPVIAAFYTGKISRIESDPFDLLEELMEMANRVDDLLDIHKERLAYTAAYWELFEVLVDARITLETATKARKWLRSSVSKGINGIGVKSETVLRYFQTLEGVARETGAIDKENSWVRISMENDLIEEDYTPEGGVTLLTAGFGQTGIFLNSIVDSDIVGEKVYGIDVQAKLEFDSDENDIVPLSYLETLNQNTYILATLRRGQTPEFDESGVSESLVVGGNRASIAYPILLRQYRDIFAKDDSYRVMRVSDVATQADSLSITLELKTVFGQPVEQTITI